MYVRGRCLHGFGGRLPLHAPGHRKGRRMSIKSHSYPNLYKDSVSLMKVSTQVMAIPGIQTASVVMASASNIENLAGAGLGSHEVRPNDLTVAVSGSDEACVAAAKA